MLLWLWCRQAPAAPIGPPAWELPCAAGEALNRKRILGVKKGEKRCDLEFRRDFLDGTPREPPFNEEAELTEMMNSRVFSERHC